MKINRNMSAVMTNRQLMRTENKLAASMERLSSGLKINHAGDNPAGIAISNKMKAQIDALDQAEANANDGTSVLQIADGALNEVSSMLQRIRELSVQAANGTNSYSDRQSIQAEINQLVKEVDRISSDTEYNTKALLDGSSDVRCYADDVTRIAVSDSVKAGEYTFTINDSTFARKTLTADASAKLGTEEGSITINGVTFDVTADMTLADIAENIRATVDEAGANLTMAAVPPTTTLGFEMNVLGSQGELEVVVSKNVAEKIFGWATVADAEAQGFALADDGTGYIFQESGKNADLTLGAGFSRDATYTADGNKVKIIDNGGFTMEFLVNPDLNGAITTLEVTEIGPMSIQIGANEHQNMDVRIPEISAESLYLDTVDVTIKGGPERALNTLDDAIARLNEVRSRIGAFQNRLEYATTSLGATEENMTSAYSTILDTDMAEEMTEYTQQNILDQATISVLSQANDLPQQVLSLLQ